MADSLLLDTNITVAARFEDLIEIRAFGLSASESHVLFDGNIEIAINFTAPELDFQNPLVSCIAHAGNDTGIGRLPQ